MAGRKHVLLRIVWNSALGGQEHGSEFGPKFLLGVVRIVESIAFVESLAVQSGRVPRTTQTCGSSRDGRFGTRYLPSPSGSELLIFSVLANRLVGCEDTIHVGSGASSDILPTFSSDNDNLHFI